jgi:hypothetical protein
LNQALKKAGAKNITKLNFSKNPRLTEKTGILIGQALIENCEHPV